LIQQITPAELAAWRADPARPVPVLIDVREPWEHAHCRIEGSLLMPMAQIPSHTAELPADRDLVFVCHHGNRSQNVAMWLERNGYTNLHNLRGGVEAWALDVEPTMPRY
jgi:rhodanese-related sulfurtransferase